LWRAVSSAVEHLAYTEGAAGSNPAPPNFSAKGTMHFLFLGIVGLTLVLVLLNVHEVIPKFVEEENRVRMMIYIGTLFFLGYLVIHLGYRAVEFNQKASELTDVRLNR
jgi:hypothetical protein